MPNQEQTAVETLGRADAILQPVPQDFRCRDPEQALKSHGQ